jgi:transglutaminase-like putative cysteine protease
MKYKITHVTNYDYAEVVAVSQNIVHLMPRATSRQRCLSHRLLVRPQPAEISRRTDFFGNMVQDFSIHQGHRSLRVMAVSKVQVQAKAIINPAAAPPWSALLEHVSTARTKSALYAYQFCFASPHITPCDELAEYARQSFPPNRSILLAARELNERIHADFTYDSQATDVQTPCLDVFRQRRGVCQDLAHVAIGCLRSLGLPARYVSGYLRTIPPPGRPRLVGADASHAWFSVYCGPLGWIDFDPTNDLLPNTDHVTVAWGRDYSDVTPIHGMFVGGGQHRLAVSVDVMPCDTSEPVAERAEGAEGGS